MYDHEVSEATRSRKDLNIKNARGTTLAVQRSTTGTMPSWKNPE